MSLLFLRKQELELRTLSFIQFSQHAHWFFKEFRLSSNRCILLLGLNRYPFVFMSPEEWMADIITTWKGRESEVCDGL